MGLVNCPDCGKMVSDLAPACVGCGRPMAPPAQQPRKPPVPEALDLSEKDQDLGTNIIPIEVKVSPSESSPVPRFMLAVVVCFVVSVLFFSSVPKLHLNGFIFSVLYAATMIGIWKSIMPSRRASSPKKEIPKDCVICGYCNEYFPVKDRSCEWCGGANPKYQDRK